MGRGALRAGKEKTKRVRKFLSSDEDIFCQECGNAFKQISWKHLLSHNMSIDEYCKKYNLLSVQLLSRNTRKIMQENSVESHRRGILKLPKTRPTPAQARKHLNKIRPTLGRIQSKTLKAYFAKMTPEERSMELSRRATLGWSRSSKERLVEARKRLDRTGKPGFWKGKKIGPMSEEQKKKLSEATKGIPKSPETRERMRLAAIRKYAEKREALSRAASAHKGLNNP